MSVISLRLKDREFKRLAELSRLSRKDKSTVARELLDQGWEFMMIKLYREGRLSLSSLAEKLDVSLSEAIDVLAEFGVESPLEFSDYIEGLQTLSKTDAP